MGSYPESEGPLIEDSVPRLTLLEQACPKLYLRLLFCFPLATDANTSEVAQMLSESWDTTKKTIPYLAAELVPDTKAPQKGRVALVPGDFGKFDAKTLDKTQFPFSYAELREQRFRASVLDGDVLCPMPQLWAPWLTTPVAVVRANFIEGGLILAICVHHQSTDAAAMEKILETWAYHFRCLQGLEDGTAPPVLSPGALDRTIPQPSGRSKGRIEDHPEFVLYDEPLTAMPPGIMKTNHRVQGFYFSPAALADLKAETMAASETKPDHHLWLSTNDALSALVWQACMRANFPDPASVPEDMVSEFMVAVNARPRMTPPMPKDHMSCACFLPTPRLAMRDIVDPATDLATVANMIRSAVNACTPEALDSCVTLLSKVPDYSCLIAACLLSMLDTAVFVTSWTSFDIYSVDWGHALGGKCERVRPTRDGFFNGCQWIGPPLPEERGGGLELFIGLEDQNLERLRENEVLKRFAVAF